MRLQPSITGRVVLLLLAVLSAAQLACVGGRIPPSMFEFANVVPYTGPNEGGWKVAQVLVLLGRISPRFSSTATCEIEVGVPERKLTALACIEFREHLQSILTHPVSGAIPGARVTAFQRVGIPRKTFP